MTDPSVTGTGTRATGADPDERFEFGDNWLKFLDLVDDDRIHGAEESLREKLGELDGRTFLDAGSGSGLFSLAARNLGARVTSFDYDTESVAATGELRRRFRPSDPEWSVQQGSVLDARYLESLGTFDIVYSWGVLHHTGDMDRALRLVADRVAPGGRLFISIYNDQGLASRLWWRVKHRYNAGGRATRTLLVETANVYFRSRTLLAQLLGLLRLRRLPERPTRRRGMDRRRDLVDWVGGFPFEVAKPEQIFRLYRDAGFRLVELTTCAGGLGCNEFVFVRS